MPGITAIFRRWRATTGFIWNCSQKSSLYFLRKRVNAVLILPSVRMIFETRRKTFRGCPLRQDLRVQFLGQAENSFGDEEKEHGDGKGAPDVAEKRWVDHLACLVGQGLAV